MQNQRIAGKSIKNLALVGLLASILAACGETKTQHAQNPSPAKAASAQSPDPYEDKLRQLVDSYNNGSIDEKSRIINELYQGKAVLTPFGYTYPWKGNKNYGNVRVGIEGRIDVYYEEGRVTKSSFELDNEPIHVGVNRDGNVSPYIVSGKVLKVPQGHSVLHIARSGAPWNPEYTGEMLWALRRFGKENPELGISTQGISGVRNGLKVFGYKP
ncbi:hypothetical protein HYT53_00770 [Candidatus Woesearchaeota archaeon]|nr:hypothetical protein [Candidatus Woesearchaeota archaeon]